MRKQDGSYLRAIDRCQFLGIVVLHANMQILCWFHNQHTFEKLMIFKGLHTHVVWMFYGSPTRIPPFLCSLWIVCFCQVHCVIRAYTAKEILLHHANCLPNTCHIKRNLQTKPQGRIIVFSWCASAKEVFMLFLTLASFRTRLWCIVRANWDESHEYFGLSTRRRWILLVGKREAATVCFTLSWWSMASVLHDFDCCGALFVLWRLRFPFWWHLKPALKFMCIVMVTESSDMPDLCGFVLLIAWRIHAHWSTPNVRRSRVCCVRTPHPNSHTKN